MIDVVDANSPPDIALINQLVKQFDPQAPLLVKALKVAQEAHGTTLRKSGTPFVNHTISVAIIAERYWGITDETILAAALLHDVIEDTSITYKYLTREFGAEVAKLVEGVSNFHSKEGVSKEERDWQSLQKFLSRSFLDPRVAVLKLADRLHNMLTLEHVDGNKQIQKSLETMTVYTKLAQSLGMWMVMNQLQDLSYKYLDPDNYKKTLLLIKNDKRLKKHFIDEFSQELLAIVKKASFKALIEPRINGTYALSRKMERYANDPALINDIVSFRVRLVDTSEQDCYCVVGHLHGHFGESVDFERFDDFMFANRRDNGYSCLQTTLDFDKIGAVEIAIATDEMEENNQWGVVTKIRQNIKNLDDYSLKIVFGNNTVHFFPKDATAIDIAYGLGGPQVGAEAKSLKLQNGESKILALGDSVPNAAKVAIETADHPRRAPDEKLLKKAKSKATRRIIENQLRLQEIDRYQEKGKDVIRRMLMKQNRGFVVFSDLGLDMAKKVYYHFGCQSLADFYYRIGFGSISTQSLTDHLDNLSWTKQNLHITTIIISGKDRPWVLRDIVNWLFENVTKKGAKRSPYTGNIAEIIYEMSDKKDEYEVRLVVQDLTEDIEENLANMLHGDKRFTALVI